MSLWSSRLLGYLGSTFTVLGVVAVVWFLVFEPTSPVRGWLRRYEQELDRRLRFLLGEVSGEKIVRFQLIMVFGAIVLGFVYNVWAGLVVALPVTLVPWFWLEKQRVERVEKLEEQLDGWLVVLANALKASPSLGDGFRTSAALVHSPMSQELDLLLKENKLGVPLDDAIRNMSKRIGSRTIGSAMVTMLIARKSGGDLPTILETTAATLREMARLEGVVRTKTAEGRSQATVLAGMPIVLVLMINWTSPTLLLPLVYTGIGNVIAAVAFVLWISAYFAARKIMAVDI